MNISIILPIHNEKESLEVMVRLLNSSLKFNHEIIVVYESKNDNSIKIGEKLSKEFSNFKIIQNKYEKGVRFAVQTGVEESRYDIIFITAVDEIFPIISIDKMIKKIVNENYDFISGTRYSKGGLRLGGSFIGAILSRLSNFIFKILTNVPLSDLTTGIKMMRKKIWYEIYLTSKPIGWVFALELSIKVILKNYKIDEIPLKSVDRLFGGKSTFKLGSWTIEYLKWFFYGISKLHKFKRKNFQKR